MDRRAVHAIADELAKPLLASERFTTKLYRSEYETPMGDIETRYRYEIGMVVQRDITIERLE
jgi:hypothetical protein